MTTIHFHITGNLHIHTGPDVSAQIANLEQTMTQSFTSASDALTALDAKVDAASAAQAELAADVRAFIANLPAPGEFFTADNSAAADAIIAKLDATTSATTALDAEVPGADNQTA